MRELEPFSMDEGIVVEDFSQERSDKLEFIKNFLSDFLKKNRVIIIGSFARINGYNDIDFIVISEEVEENIFSIFNKLAIKIDEYIDIVILTPEKYEEFIKTGQSINSHQVFSPYRSCTSAFSRYKTIELGLKNE